MAKKSQASTFKDENRLVISLVLADYPKREKQTFIFEYLKNIHPEKYGSLDILKMLSGLKKIAKFKMKYFVFDKFSTMQAENSEWRAETIRRISKNKSKKTQKILDNILQSRFNFSDLKLAFKEYKNCFWEIADNIDFEIIMTVEAQEKITMIAEKYVEYFMKKKLKTDEGKYLDFEQHKKKVFQKIGNDPEIFTKSLAFAKDDFEKIKNFRFYECFLAMEQDGLIEINNIVPAKDENKQTVIPIGFTLTPKYFKITNKNKNRKFSAEYIPRGSMGYFRVKKNTKWKKIDHIRSRNYLLLKFLIDQRRDNKIATFKKAFEAIRDGTHYDKKGYEDEKLGAFINAKKFLQKEGKIKPHKIIIDKQEENIWIE